MCFCLKHRWRARGRVNLDSHFQWCSVTIHRVCVLAKPSPHVVLQLQLIGGSGREPRHQNDTDIMIVSHAAQTLLTNPNGWNTLLHCSPFPHAGLEQTVHGFRQHPCTRLAVSEGDGFCAASCTRHSPPVTFPCSIRRRDNCGLLIGRLCAEVRSRAPPSASPCGDRGGYASRAYQAAGTDTLEVP